MSVPRQNDAASAEPADEVRLRQTVEADLDTLFEHQADPEAARMAGFPSRDRPTFFAHWTGLLADPSVVKETVLLDGEVAGSLVCFGAEGAREVGYWIGREFWGRRVATRSLRLFLERMRDRPLRGFVVPTNVASQQVLLKCGFVPDGEDGDHLVFVLHADGISGWRRGGSG